MTGWWLRSGGGTIESTHTGSIVPRLVKERLCRDQFEPSSKGLIGVRWHGPLQRWICMTSAHTWPREWGGPIPPLFIWYASDYVLGQSTELALSTVHICFTTQPSGFQPAPAFSMHVCRGLEKRPSSSCLSQSFTHAYRNFYAVQVVIILFRHESLVLAF